MNPQKEQDVFERVVSADNDGRDLFVRTFGSKLRRIAKFVALAFEGAEPLRELAVADGRAVTGHCWGQLFLVMESCASATKLLVAGHINAAGNTMRVAYEALATALLLAGNVKVMRRNAEHDYRSAFIRGDSWAWPYKSIKYIEKHQREVGLNDEGVTFLKAGIEFYNNHSHATAMAFAAKIGNVSHTANIAGGYNPQLEEQARWYVKFILRFVKQLPGIVGVITCRVTTEFREDSMTKT